MTHIFLGQVILLIAGALAAVMLLQRLRMPSSLGYLAVGIVLGPHALNLAPEPDRAKVIAELGIVFLLFTVGLNFSLPRIRAMGRSVFVLGTAQVLLTTVLVGAGLWWAGLPLVAALAVGAVVAQSSTTVIARQLVEQGEGDTRHGRLATAMSVFQDVTAVPLVVILPVLGGMGGSMGGPLALAAGKALLAFLLVYGAGRWLLRPAFHVVANSRSPEMFTLAVLLVTLLAAALTSALGLSMALGAFLAGMMLGDTEFRHQLESSIRPFRDVLLGLFFVTIGMLADFSVLPSIWQQVAITAVGLMVVKALLVSGIVRLGGIDMRTALRVGLVLAVGGEFGFALLAISLEARLLDPLHAQVVLNAVLLSMALGPLVIRSNGSLAAWLWRHGAVKARTDDLVAPPSGLQDHVILCGYGRVGRSVALFLAREGVPYVAVDLDADLVRDAFAQGEPVYYADAAEADILEALGLDQARLLVVTHDDLGAARKTLAHARRLRPELPVTVRTRDEEHLDELLAAGAREVIPETLEAALMMAAHVLLLAGVAPSTVMLRIREQQLSRYGSLSALYRNDGEHPGASSGETSHRSVPR